MLFRSHKWLSIRRLRSWVMSLPSFLSLLERSGLDEEVEVGLDENGGFQMEDDDEDLGQSFTE